MAVKNEEKAEGRPSCRGLREISAKNQPIEVRDAVERRRWRVEVR